MANINWDRTIVNRLKESTKREVNKDDFSIIFEEKEK